MIKRKILFYKTLNIEGFFKNEYEVEIVGNDKVVTDHGTNLIWH